MYDEVRSAADFISRRFDKVPRLALMTGTGFLKVLELMTIKEAINFDEIPNFPRKLNRSNGQFILAELSGIPLILMTGRLHFYEGFSKLTANVLWLQEVAYLQDCRLLIFLLFSATQRILLYKPNLAITCSHC